MPPLFDKLMDETSLVVKTIRSLFNFVQWNEMGKTGVPTPSGPLTNCTALMQPIGKESLCDASVASARWREQMRRDFHSYGWGWV